MITAVDTNILIDIFTADPEFGECSKTALRACIQDGAVTACDIVWAETATIFGKVADCRQAMEQLGMDFSPLSCEASLHAAQTWHHYRKSGGTLERIVADFLIGAHAFIQCDRLLTRDRGFYKPHFKDLTILNPTLA